MSAQAKKHVSWKILLIGAVIVLLAAALVLLAVFLPRARQKKRMEEILNTFLSGKVPYVAVTDPLWDTGDLLGNNGMEVVLDEAQSEVFFRELQSIADAGLKWSGEKKLPAGSFDRRVLTRTVAGGIAQFYITEGTVSYLDGENYYSFTQKGEYDGIGRLYAALTGYLEEDNT